MASLLLHALKGAHAEVLQEPGVLDRLRKVGQLTGIFAQELTTAAGLAPYGIRSLKVRSSVPVAGTAAAAAAAGGSAYGVVLYPAVSYGPKPRHLVDIYVPSPMYNRQQQQQHDQQHIPAASTTPPSLPVVFFCHGGIWATGDRWHFGPLAVTLAQAGAVVAVVSYTLYPDALASEMAGEVLAALVWTMHEIGRYGGDAKRVTVLGHSAGGHLGSLAVMMLAQQRQLAVDAAAAAAAVGQGQPPQQQQQQHKPPVATALEARAQFPQQQQQQQQRSAAAAMRQVQHTSRRLKQLWYIPDALSLPPVQLFIGMSSVYDVALHFEFESMRGVAGISTMARACGGAAMFDAVSPAVLLKRAAAAVLPATKQRRLRRQQQQQQHHQQLQPVHWPQFPAAATAAAAAGYSFNPAHPGRQSLRRFSGPGAKGFAVNPDLQNNTAAAADSRPQLHGEVIPKRSGMEHPAHFPSSSSTRHSVGSSSSTSSGDSSSGSRVVSSFFGDAAELLADFSLQDAAHMPPCIIMSSCGDHMVPWHEGADMLLSLRSCGVPAKHLIYDRYLHNDFVMDWNPIKVDSAESSEAPAAAVVEGSAAAAAAEGLVAVPAAAAAAAAGTFGVAEVTSIRNSSSSSNGGSSGLHVPAFAQDLINIITGQVQVQFSSSSDLLAGTGDVLPPGAVATCDDTLRLGPWFSTPRPHSRL